MAGTIVADTIQDGAGNSTSMDNAIYGSAKAWVNFNGSTGAIRKSYNVSSITKPSTGTYTVNFTNALADANYSLVASCAPAYGVNSAFADVYNNNSGAYVGTTTAAYVFTRALNTQAALDTTAVAVAVFD